MGSYADILDQRDPPDSVVGQVDSVRAAIDSFTLAAQSLYSATGSAGSDSLQRFTVVYDRAVTEYNGGLRQLYSGTRIDPPLL